MKSTIFLDPDFNFLLLENEESDTPGETKFFINVHTSAAANQRFDIAVAGASQITIYLPSSTSVNFEITSNFWADDAATEITPKNASITADTITINFPKSFETSAALNYISDTEFEVAVENEAYAEGLASSGTAGASAGSSAGGYSSFDFVEIIRNIGFRLLDEPSNVNIYYDESQNTVALKWTDPADINTNEPAPATWAGTVVVRKEGSAPRHKWDGTIITDSTIRDQYSSNALIDSALQAAPGYYYGIFPYDTKGDYRYTKVVSTGIVEPTHTFTMKLKASEGLKYQNQNPIALYGSMGSYDSGSQSYYFSQNCIFSFSSPAKISKVVLENCSKITVEFTGKVLSGSQGQAVDLDIGFEVQNQAFSSAAMLFTSANGLYDTPEQTTLMRVNFGASSWQGTAPLEASAYIGNFHHVKYVLNMDHGTATTAACYVDDVEYATKTFNTELNLEQDEYFVIFASMEQCYIKDYSIEAS